MKIILIALAVALSSSALQAEYQQVNLTVFGMDCAPCAHAIHVSMKGIEGVNTVDVDLNTGLVSIRLNPGNHAAMHLFNEAVEKNGFTQKDADIIAKGKLTGTASAPVLQVEGTADQYVLVPAAGGVNLALLLGKAVTITGTLPQAPKGKVASALRYKTVTDAR